MKEIKPAKGYALIFAIIKMLSLIPIPASRIFGRLLGRFFVFMPLNRIKVCFENLQGAFKDSMTADEIKDLQKRILIHFGQMLFEVPHIQRLKLSNLNDYIIFENEAHFLSAVDKGRGVLILTGHLGNWELMSAAIALRFAPNSAVIVRPIDFPAMDRIIGNLRSRFGTEIYPKKHAMRRLMRAMKEKKVVGILLDQNVDWYEGVFVDFFGKPACTNKGLALVANWTGATVLPAFSVRQPDGRIRVIFEKEVQLIRTGDKTKDIEENTALFTSIIESYVRRYPDQWFWFHKRWKTKPFCKLPQGMFK